MQIHSHQQSSTNLMSTICRDMHYNGKKPSLKQVNDIRFKYHEMYVFRSTEAHQFKVNTRYARTPGHYAGREEDYPAYVSRRDTVSIGG